MQIFLSIEGLFYYNYLGINQRRILNASSEKNNT